MIIYPESGQLAPPLSPPTNISLLGYLDGLSIRGLPASLPDPPPLQESILSIAGRVTPYKCESDHSLPCLKHVSDFRFPTRKTTVLPTGPRRSCSPAGSPPHLSPLFLRLSAWPTLASLRFLTWAFGSMTIVLPGQLASSCQSCDSLSRFLPISPSQ